MKEIQLINSTLKTQVDDEDYDWLMQWDWLAVKRKGSYYAVRYEQNKDGSFRVIHMDREVMRKAGRL